MGGTLSSLHFLCPYQRKPISVDAMRKHDLTSLPLTKTCDFFKHHCTGMTEYVASCSQGSFRGLHACSHLHPRQNVQQRWASGTPWLPQLGKRKKHIQLRKCRDLELHVTCFCSLALFYFGLIFYLQASTIAKFCGGMRSPSPASRQTERLRKCHRNKLR